MQDIDKLQKLANTIRVISAEGVQKANSGHPGLPMGCADIAAILWSKYLRHNPKDSQWFNRDRFVLSAGHGSMLIYSLLHLYGYDVTNEDLKDFRQLGSRTPGHPEFGHTDGVETTTGPLGQGIANAVGMALGEKIHAEKFNTKQHEVVKNKVYALCGDGCMMEGIASEASSTAGHLGLNNLVLIYDSNQITIEGSTDIAFTEDVAKRYEAYGWDVLHADGHDFESLDKALSATDDQAKPTLIIATTTIGKGSPNKSGTHKVHGAPLGQDEVDATREALGFSLEAFSVEEDVYAFAKESGARGLTEQNEWQATYDAWATANPELKAAWDQDFSLELPADLEYPEFAAGESVASRKSSNIVLNKLAGQLPNLIGGSADLDCSNLTRMEGMGDINTNAFAGRNLHFGVREHAMGAICNGMQIYGGFRTYCSTFLVFSDYMRHTIRLAGLMKQPVIYVFTHDSIFVGEDGPTHQPIEHKVSLEIIPGLTVIRPADANEVNGAWKAALENKTGPTALLLSRQNLITLEGSGNVDKGAYVLKKESGATIDGILMASGSEVGIAMDAAKALEAQGKSIRVVSVPSVNIFDKQSSEYKESVLPTSVRKRFALDFGTGLGWHKFIGLDGEVLSIDGFGECGPGGQVADHFGFSVQSVTDKVSNYLTK